MSNMASTESTWVGEDDADECMHASTQDTASIKSPEVPLFHESWIYLFREQYTGFRIEHSAHTFRNASARAFSQS